MTDQQGEHITSLINQFGDLAFAKYEKGTIEHGTNLWENPSQNILDFAIEEAIDQVVYLLTLKEQLYGKD